MGKGFSYSMVQSDEAREIVAKMVNDDADRIITFRGPPLAEALAAGKVSWTRRGLTAAKLVAVWFTLKGPTAFATMADATTYRLELIRAVDAKLIPIRIQDDIDSRSAAAKPWID